MLRDEDNHQFFRVIQINWKSSILGESEYLGLGILGNIIRVILHHNSLSDLTTLLLCAAPEGGKIGVKFGYPSRKHVSRDPFGALLSSHRKACDYACWPDVISDEAREREISLALTLPVV
jgi:hypothetical protein